MAKELLLSYHGKHSSFQLAKLDRSRLYGAKKRIAVDHSQQPCTKASLTSDGMFLLHAGMTAQGYFDETGRWLQKSELVGLDAEGNQLDLKPSTLGTEQIVTRAEPWDVLSFSVVSVYLLEPINIDAELSGLVDSGAVMRFDFNYSADYKTETAFLVKNNEGLFALICEPSHFGWCEPGKVEDVEDFEESADELDFDMF